MTQEDLNLIYLWISPGVCGWDNLPERQKNKASTLCGELTGILGLTYSWHDANTVKVLSNWLKANKFHKKISGVADTGKNWGKSKF